jgi:hypothetical protein
MEITLDARVVQAAKIIGVLICVVLVYWTITMIVPVFTPKPAELPKYDFQAQMDFMSWTICQRTDAIQMYLQNQDSNHPQVLKLKSDINIYNKMAAELGTKNFSASDCNGGN